MAPERETVLVTFIVIGALTVWLCWDRIAPRLAWLMWSLVPKTMEHVSTVSPDVPTEVTSSEAPDERTDADGRGRTRSSEADILRERLQLDRTRAALIAYLAHEGFTLVEMRGLLKGANDTIGAEYNMAIGKPPPPAQPDDDELITPFAGRRTKASYYPDDPQLEYKPPAN